MDIHKTMQLQLVTVKKTANKKKIAIQTHSWSRTFFFFLFILALYVYCQVLTVLNYEQVTLTRSALFKRFCFSLCFLQLPQNLLSMSFKRKNILTQFKQRTNVSPLASQKKKFCDFYRNAVKKQKNPTYNPTERYKKNYAYITY